jgi:Zincin-like metallopeptidase
LSLAAWRSPPGGGTPFGSGCSGLRFAPTSFGGLTPERVWFAPCTSLTLGHEATHWSGAPQRLNRDLSTHFGSEAYAMEELVAEIVAAFLCVTLGVSRQKGRGKPTPPPSSPACLPLAGTSRIAPPPPGGSVSSGSVAQLFPLCGKLPRALALERFRCKPTPLGQAYSGSRKLACPTT